MPHTHVHNARSILRGDPTRTLPISRRWIADINRRVRAANQEVVNFISTLDVFGLSPRKKPQVLVANVEPRQYEFQTDAQKLSTFNAWFRRMVDEEILGVSGPGNPLQPWNYQYVESAYKKGITNAYLDSPQFATADMFGVGTQTADEFLRSSFLLPERVDKVRLMATRSFEQLRGFTSTMASRTNTILAQAIADGDGARKTAKAMTDAMSNLTKRQAHTIARTEIINAHANGQLDTFQQLGVEELGVKAEWITAGDDRVCPDCLDGENASPYSLDEARGLIPFHPNCRCTWIPFVPDPGSKKR